MSRRAATRARPCSPAGEVGRDLLAVDWARTPLGPPEAGRAACTTHRPRPAHLALLDVDGVGPGADVLLQRRLPARHARQEVPVGARAAPRARCGRRSGRTSARASRPCCAPARRPGTRRCCCSSSAAATPRRPTTRSPTARWPTTTGAIAGMLCVVREDTERVIGERRLATLRDLGAGHDDRAHRGRGAGRGAHAPRRRPALAAVRARSTSTTTTARARLGARPSRDRTRRTAARATRAARGRSASEALLVEDLASASPTCRPAPGTSRRDQALVVPLPQQGQGARRVPRRRRSTGTGRSTRATAASSTWSPARSPPASPTPAPTRRSAGAPRRWPSSTGPRRRSSPTSATSSARR